MKIQMQELYHGAVLTQITEHPSFKALNKADSQYGHYLVNNNIRVIVKYLTKGYSPWVFEFSPSELLAMKKDMKTTNRVYLCLICGQETICALNEEEITSLIDLDAFTNQAIVVDAPSSGSMYVTGTVGKLPRTLQHNSFPNRIFEPALERVGSF